MANQETSKAGEIVKYAYQNANLNRKTVEGYGGTVEDLAQDSLVRVARTGMANIQNPRNFMVRVVRTTAMDAYEIIQGRNKKAPMISFEANRDSLISHPQFIAESPEDITVKNDAIRQAVTQSLISLPNMQRTVTTARLNGETSAEVADRLHISPNDVSANFSIGIRTLRKSLAEQGIQPYVGTQPEQTQKTVAKKGNTT